VIWTPTPPSVGTHLPAFLQHHHFPIITWSQYTSMAAKEINLQQLPDELLGLCFSLLHQSTLHPRRGSDGIQDIQNLRLVSKRCNDISSSFFLYSIQVYVTSASISHMEELCEHPIVSKSIKEVEISCSYYNSLLAGRPGLFAASRAGELYTKLATHFQLVWRIEDDASEQEESLEEAALTQASVEWRALNKHGFLESGCELTPKQKWILRVHDQYRELYDDQEQVKNGHAHIRRICAALTKLPRLQSIVLSDAPRSYKTSHPKFSEPDLLRACLSASNWKKPYNTTFPTRPPVEMIRELFTALAETNIRPLKFALDFNPPGDLHSLLLNDAEKKAIKTVLSNSQTLTFITKHWERTGHIVENNNRSRAEMLVPCALTSTYFDSTTVRKLVVAFDDFPAPSTFPNVTIADILPLSDQSWPRLQFLSMRCIPFSLTEAQKLVEILKGRLEVLECHRSYLTHGSWVAVVDAFKRFEKLKTVTITQPRGAEFGKFGRCFFPTKEIGKYIINSTSTNPLIEYLKRPEENLGLAG
jgi:hypothetical protein